VRIKDLSHILEARENQLMGFGLVVGLSRSGDSRQTAFTDQALTNLLSRMGVVPQTVDFRSRNTAAVIVTANLPPFVKPGQRIDITLSSVGDATSLRGGTLLLTPLQGVDEEIYAVAQGTLSLGTLGEDPNIPPMRRAETNAGYIPGGALVEKEVPVSLGKNELLTIVLNDPDFTTAVRVADSIKSIGMDATAKDAATVTVKFSEAEDAVSLIARIENLTVIPDTVAKVVINERTGTIVMGENVRIAPVAVAYSGMNITIGDIKVYAEATASLAEESRGDLISTQSGVTVRRINTPLTIIPASASLADLVQALNAVRARPQDLIVILQALKRAGALNAQIEVI
jgi:flagellar P-ring protein FlgI